MGIFVAVLGLVLLLATWFVGDQEFRTKVILTLIYLGLWVFLFLDPTGGWLMFAGQALFCLVLGSWTFGGRLGRR
jgi:hypothetical protein